MTITDNRGIKYRVQSWEKKGALLILQIGQLPDEVNTDSLRQIYTHIFLKDVNELQLALKKVQASCDDLKQRP